MGKLEHVVTPAIASNTATIQSSLCDGFVMEWRIDVRTSAGAASASTCTVTIKDNVFNRTLFTKTGITGIENYFDPFAEIQDSGGTATGLRKPFYLANQRFTVTITSGANTNYVEVWAKIAS
jgi:hypothetical protein